MQMRRLAGGIGCIPAPSRPQESVREQKEEESDKRRQQMEEVHVAHDKMDADRAAEPGASHDSDNFHQAAVEFRAAGHKEQQRTDGA